MGKGELKFDGKKIEKKVIFAEKTQDYLIYKK